MYDLNVFLFIREYFIYLSIYIEMWNNIVNPKTGRKVALNSKLGRYILNKFIKQLGGVRFKNKEEEKRFNEFKKRLRVMEQEKRVRRLEDKFIEPIKNKNLKN